MSGADFWLNVLVLLIMVTTLSMKALAIRRHSELGKSMAVFNFTLVVAYLTAVLGYFTDIFNEEWFRFGIRIAIMITAIHVIWALQKSYGGWTGLHREIWNSFLDLLPFGCGDKVTRFRSRVAVQRGDSDDSD